MAQRFVVNVLENNKPYLDEEEGISEEEETEIMKQYDLIIDKQYDLIIDRLNNVAVKNGGNFNRYTG